MGKYTIEYEDGRDRVVEIIREIKELKPDVVIWCDWAACRLKENVEKFFAMPIFKEENYLPKALLMPDCFNEYVDVTPTQRLLLDYVTAPNFVNERLDGFEFTEDATPYRYHPFFTFFFTSLSIAVVLYPPLAHHSSLFNHQFIVSTSHPRSLHRS
jgi:hypothetical protein